MRNQDWPVVIGRRRRVAETLATFALLAAVGWFFLWTVDPEGKAPWFSAAEDSYYNLQARGFLKGQAAMDVAPDPALAKIANPYNPAERGALGIHDASYYQGRYFLYFGASPAVLVTVPLRLLTGRMLTDEYLILVLCLAGFGAAAGLWLGIVRRSFPNLGPGIRLAGIAALGLANLVPLLLRRTGVWEVPIACAFALAMTALGFVWRSLQGGRAARAWLALASLAFGLCIGARPTYFFGGALLLVPLVVLLRSRRRPGLTVAAAVLPIAAVGLGLAWFNHARFGSPLEFGQRYQLSGDDASRFTMFGLRYFWFNARLYLLAAPGLSPFFPFIIEISPPKVPAGQFGIEDPYGLLPAAPWILLALGTLPAIFGRWSALLPNALPLRAWLIGAWLLAGLTAAVIFSFGGATGRYEVDFAPTLVLLAAVGAAALTQESRGFARVAGSLAVVLCLWSSGIGVFASIRHNRLLEILHPAAYARAAHGFNGIVSPVVRAAGARYGPVELKVVFPTGARGEVEPLVVTGNEFLSDYIYAHYLGDDLVRFGFEHTSRRSAVGTPVKFTPGQEQTILVQMGSLYPPRAHPYFDALAPAEIEARANTVVVKLNGEASLDLKSDTYDATDLSPSIGTSGPRPAFKRDFTGRVVSVRRVDPLPPPPPVAEQPKGALRLAVRFPTFSGRRGDPLLCSGATNVGDLIFVSYLDESHLAIGHDHWGGGATLSEPIPYVPGGEAIFEISCPPLLGAESPAHLEVKLDGKTVVSREAPFHPAAASQLWIGQNPIGMSSSGPAFTGEIVNAVRLPPSQ